MLMRTSTTNRNRSNPMHAALCAAALLALAAGQARAQIVTTPTMDPGALADALHASGMTIDSVVIRHGVAGQFGTYSNFTAGPVTIRDGIVMSSGNVASMGPLAEVLDPNYDPASPPPAVNSQMTFETDPDGNILSGGTPEFDAYGSSAGNIDNFYGSYDVAALEVHFTLDGGTPVKFDFIFGSVEFPFYTSSFTDAFLVFVDGVDVTNQVTFDTNNSAVQVGSSFAGLETTSDVNTAFSNPHALIHHLTTTTPELNDGEHTIIFEVGDVNDHILDSAVFFTHLRAEAGTEGTDPTEDCTADFDQSGHVDADDLFAFLDAWFAQNGQSGSAHSADVDDSHLVDADDLFVFLDRWFSQDGTCS
jgi:hypothetical protein